MVAVLLTHLEVESPDRKYPEDRRHTQEPIGRGLKVPTILADLDANFRHLVFPTLCKSCNAPIDHTSDLVVLEDS